MIYGALTTIYLITSPSQQTGKENYMIEQNEFDLFIRNLDIYLNGSINDFVEALRKNQKEKILNMLHISGKIMFMENGADSKMCLEAWIKYPVKGYFENPEEGQDDCESMIAHMARNIGRFVCQHYAVDILKNKGFEEFYHLLTTDGEILVTEMISRYKKKDFVSYFVPEFLKQLNNGTL
jgi:hypothetical protein